MAAAGARGESARCGMPAGASTCPGQGALKTGVVSRSTCVGALEGVLAPPAAVRAATAAAALPPNETPCSSRVRSCGWMRFGGSESCTARTLPISAAITIGGGSLDGH